MWLIVTIDHAIGEVPFALLVDSYCTENNMRLMKKLVERKGIPAVLYTDGGQSFYDKEVLLL